MNPRAHPWATAGAIAALVVLLIAIFWNWDWFRPLAEAEASAALGREVEIGHLDVELGSPSRLILDDVTVKNPDGFQGDPMATAKQLAVAFKPWAAITGSYVLPEIRIVKPRGDLRRNGEDVANWALPAFENAGENVGEKDGGTDVEIGRLLIEDGKVRFRDPHLVADFTATFHTEDGEAPRLLATAEGSYNGDPFNADFTGGSLLSLREKNDPYPLDLSLSYGKTRASVKGTLTDPLYLAGANVDLTLEGPDLAKLEALTAIPLAPTPPYDLKGKLDFAEGRISFRNFEGHVGDSDLSGDFTVDPGEERPKVTANLTSGRLVLADLGGFIGAAPGREAEPGMTEEQKARHAREEAGPRLLPDRKLDIPELRSTDFDVRFEGKRIVGEDMPIDNLVTHLKIVDGKVTVDPLDFGIGEGAIESKVMLDAREEPVKAEASVDFERVDLRQFLDVTDVFKGAGTIGGRIFVDTTGQSFAEMAGNGNGEVKLFMTGGDISALLVNLAGLDLGGSILSALGLPDETPIRCMVSDFDLREGVLKTQAFYLDTEAATITGTGTVDLDKETIDYRIGTQPKQPSIGAFPAPIDIEGPLGDPAIGPDAGELAARAAPSIALGVLLTPLAALIPTIQLGLGEDSDCAASVRKVVKESQELPEAAGDEE